MARLTILPDSETDAVDPDTTDNTRPEPREPTPPTTSPAQPPPSNIKHENDTNEPKHPIEEPSPPTPKSATTNPTTETTTYIARTDTDLIAALKLTSDSVAQQRQLAATALLTHPAYWSALLLILPYFYVEWYHDSSDWPLIIVIWVGVFMATLAVIKWVVRGYLDAAERVGRWSWLYGDQWIRNRFGRSMNLNLGSQGQGQGRGQQTPRAKRARGDRDPDFKTDYVFVTKLGDTIIAALVVRIENTWYLNTHPTPHPLKTTNSDNKGNRLQNKAIIRAWTVEQRYRGNGIGIALLRFVVRWCLDNEIEGPEFSESHAHSLRLLPDSLNRKMDGNDRRAREKLYWEIQHYISGRGLQQEVKKEGSAAEGVDGSLDEKGGVAGEGEDGVDVGDWFGPGSGPRTIISPRKRVQMSAAITRQILKGD